jgi:hypothetical protein
MSIAQPGPKDLNIPQKYGLLRIVFVDDAGFRPIGGQYLKLVAWTHLPTSFMHMGKYCLDTQRFDRVKKMIEVC